MATVKLPDGKVVRVDDGLSEKEVAKVLIAELPDDYDDFKEQLHVKFKIDKESSGWGSTIGGLGGGLAGAASGAAAGAALGSVVPILGTAVGGLAGGVIGGFLGGGAGGAGGEYAEQKLRTDYDDAVDTDALVKAGLVEGGFGALGGVGGLIGRGGKAGAKIAAETGEKLGLGTVAKRGTKGLLDKARNLPVIKYGFGTEGVDRLANLVSDLPNSVKEDVIEKSLKEFNVNWGRLAEEAEVLTGKSGIDVQKAAQLLKSGDAASVNKAKRIIERTVHSRAEKLVSKIKTGDVPADVLKKLGISTSGKSSILNSFGKPIGNATEHLFESNAEGLFPTREVTDAIKSKLYDDLFGSLTLGNVATTGRALTTGANVANQAVQSYNNKNDGGAIANKARKVYNEGYTAPGQAYAIAKNYQKRGLLHK